MKRSVICYILQLIFMGILGAVLAVAGIRVSENPGIFFLILVTVLAYGAFIRLEAYFKIVETFEKIKEAHAEMSASIKESAKSLKDILRGKDDPYDGKD